MMKGRLFASMRLPPKLIYNSAGELDIMHCPGFEGYIRSFFFCGVAYLYILSRVDSKSPLGKLKNYSLVLFGGLFSWQVHRFAKLLLHMSVVDGGEILRLEKYPLFGFGHTGKLMIPVHDIDALLAYGEKTWYNPYRWGRGFYKLRFTRGSQAHREKKDYVIFRIPKDYNKDALKLMLLKKPITEKSLQQLAALKRRKHA